MKEDAWGLAMKLACLASGVEGVVGRRNQIHHRWVVRGRKLNRHTWRAALCNMTVWTALLKCPCKGLHFIDIYRQGLVGNWVSSDATPEKTGHCKLKRPCRNWNPLNHQFMLYDYGCVNNNYACLWCVVYWNELILGKGLTQIRGWENEQCIVTLPIQPVPAPLRNCGDCTNIVPRLCPNSIISWT